MVFMHLSRLLHHFLQLLLSKLLLFSKLLLKLLPGVLLQPASQFLPILLLCLLHLLWTMFLQLLLQLLPNLLSDLLVELFPGRRS